MIIKRSKRAVINKKEKWFSCNSHLYHRYECPTLIQDGSYNINSIYIYISQIGMRFNYKLERQYKKLLAYQQLNDDYELVVLEDPDESQIINNIIPDFEVRDLLYDQAISKRTNFITTSDGGYINIEQSYKNINTI